MTGGPHQVNSPQGVPFDGVLSHFTDRDYDLIERVVSAIAAELPLTHLLRSNAVVSKFCAFLAGTVGPATQLEPGLTWKDGEVVASKVDTKDIEPDLRNLAYTMAALLPNAREAARLLEAAGIAVWSRRLD